MPVVIIVITRTYAAVAIVSRYPHSETFRVILTFLEAYVQCGNAVHAKRLFYFLCHCHALILSMNCFRHFTSTKANCEASCCRNFLNFRLINSVQSRSSCPFVRNFVTYVKKDYYMNRHSYLCLYNQLFALFYYVLSFLTL